MKHLVFVLTLCVWALPGRAAPQVDPELTRPEFVREVVLHAYQWHFSDSFFLATADQQEFAVWVRMREMELDPGDKSRFAELYIPSAGLLFRLKKTDYFIEELGLAAQSDGYKISSFELVRELPKSDEFAIVTLNRDQAREWIEAETGRTRGFAPGEVERISAAASRWIGQHAGKPGTEPQRLYIANSTPVSGVIWVCWPEGRLLLRLEGELGFKDDRLERFMPLQVEAYDLRTQVVASLLEHPGSNAYLTKEWTGRVLYECLVAGVRHDWSGFVYSGSVN